MFARITPYQLKAGSMEAATERANSLRSEIMALPGMMEFINVVDSNGKGYVVSLVESREHSEGNVEKVREIWGKLGEFLAKMPTPESYDVVAHWQK